MENPTIWWVSVNDFYRQMFELKGKTVVYLDDYDPENEMHVAITFDGVYKNVLTFAAPIMKKFSYPFELFISSDYIGKNNAFDQVEPNAQFASLDDLKALEKLGGRIQWHTRSHPDLSQIDNVESIQNELIIPHELKKIFPIPSFKWFAYPYGRHNELVISETKKYFSGALSCVEGNTSDKYCLNRITVTNDTSFSNYKLSCIIASYNYGAYLPEAIESVLKQTIPAHEILIMDDASEDNTQEVGEFYSNIYPNYITYYRNETNLGIVNNFNKAVSLSNGDFIVFLGADNRFLSNYFEKCISVFIKNKNIAIAYTDLALFDSRAMLVYNSFDFQFKGEIIENKYYIINFPEFENKNDALELIKKKNFLHGSSVFSAKAFKSVGGYIEKIGNPEDHNLFTRILGAGYECSKATGTFLEYRQHSHSQANNRVGIEAKLHFYIKKTIYLEKELHAYQSIKNSPVFKFITLTEKSISFIRNRGFLQYIKLILSKIKK